MYSLLGSFIGGISSALISGGTFNQSGYHFGVFIACLFVFSTLGAILDALSKK